MADFNGEQLVEIPTFAFGPLDPHPATPAFDPSGGDSTAPTISNFDPAVGTPIERDTPVSFDVVDASGLLRVIVLVQLRGTVLCVHDGERFRGDFTNYSSRTPITNGWRYTVRPNGGWVSPPTFELLAVDTDGNEAT